MTPKADDRPALDTIRRVARVAECVCCGVPLVGPAPGVWGACCPRCVAAGCNPFLGLAPCQEKARCGCYPPQA